MTWHSKSYMFSQQTTRDSKRRSSKEAGALSKDGQPVAISSSGDAEPGNVCDERWRQARSLWRGRWPELWAVHQKTGWWFTESVWMTFASDFARSWLLISVIYNISNLHMSPSKDPGMLHLCCAIAKCMREAESGPQNSAHTLHRAFLPCLWCRSGNVSLS